MWFDLTSNHFAAFQWKFYQYWPKIFKQSLTIELNIDWVKTIILHLNRYRRKLVARTRRKKRRKYSRPLLAKFACGQVSSLRLYRLNQNSCLGFIYNVIFTSDIFRRFWDYQCIFAICSCDWKLHLNLTELALRAANNWSTCIGFRSEGLSGPLEILSVFKEPELHNHVMYIVSRITSFTILLKILKVPQALKSTCWIRKLMFL